MEKKFKWMPVFKVGQWKPKSGKLFVATKEIVNEIVAATKAKANTIVPFVLNHPSNESFSFGGFKSKDVRVNGDYIEILPSEMQTWFAEQFNAGSFKGVSVKLGADRSLEHLGFLTENPPAVEGLPSYVFEGEVGSECFEFSGEEFGDYRVSAIGDIFQNMRDKMIESDGIDAAEAVLPQSILDTLKQVIDDPPQWIIDWLNRLQSQIDNGGFNNVFSTQVEEVNKVTIDEIQAKLDAEQARNASLQQENDRNREKSRTMEFEKYLDSNEMKGRITPANKPIAMDIMKAIDGEEKLEFSSGEKMTALEKFQEFLKALPKQVVIGRSVVSEEFAGNDDETTKGKSIADELNKKRGVK